SIIEKDSENQYVLFGSSLRKQEELKAFYRSLKCDTSRVVLKIIPIPPTILDLLWNSFALFPIEWFVGDLDVFWSSDWTQPPLSRAVGMTTIHDLAVMRYPESFHKTIIAVQNRRLRRAKKECTAFLCDSEATK